MSTAIAIAPSAEIFVLAVPIFRPCESTIHARFAAANAGAGALALGADADAEALVADALLAGVGACGSGSPPPQWTTVSAAPTRAIDDQGRAEGRAARMASKEARFAERRQALPRADRARRSVLGRRFRRDGPVGPARRLAAIADVSR
jgi:hypothetical protein